MVSTTIQGAASASHRARRSVARQPALRRKAPHTVRFCQWESGPPCPREWKTVRNAST